MKLSIENEGALPIAYAIQCGDNVGARSLFKGNPLMVESEYIHGSYGGIVVMTKGERFIFENDPNLIIKFVL